MVSLIALVVKEKISLEQLKEVFDVSKKFNYQMAPGELLIFNGVEYLEDAGLNWHENAQEKYKTRDSQDRAGLGMISAV